MCNVVCVVYLDAECAVYALSVIHRHKHANSTNRPIFTAAIGYYMTVTTTINIMCMFVCAEFGYIE